MGQLEEEQKIRNVEVPQRITGHSEPKGFRKSDNELF
jgi:hypothetical protein